VAGEAVKKAVASGGIGPQLKRSPVMADAPTPEAPLRLTPGSRFDTVSPRLIVRGWRFACGTRVPAVLVVLASGGALTACDNTVKLPQTDTTPPSATLTAFQGNVGSVFGSNVHLQETGQDISRKVGLKDTVEFLGVGEDDDGGVKRVSIDVDWTTDCDLGNGLGKHQNYFEVIGQSQDLSNPTPGTSVPRTRAASGRTIIGGHCSPQQTLTGLTAKVTVNVENYYALQATTKTLFLTFP